MFRWWSVKYVSDFKQLNSPGFYLLVYSEAENVRLWPECGEEILEHSLGLAYVTFSII